MAVILLIEDDSWLADLYTDALGDSGHLVHRVASAKDAIELLEEESVDVIVLDLFLPQHNGIALLHELRASSLRATIPVIVQSSLAAEQSGLAPAAWESYGIAAYLHKGTDRPGDLVRAVQRVIA